jgi:hypothetical protein
MCIYDCWYFLNVASKAALNCATKFLYSTLFVSRGCCPLLSLQPICYAAWPFKIGPEKESEYKQEQKKTANLTESLSKIFYSKYNTMLGANDRRTGSKWRRKRSMCHVPKESFKNQNQKLRQMQEFRRHWLRRLRGKFLHLLSWRVHYILLFVGTWRLHWWQFQICLLKLPVWWNCDNF